MSGNIKLRKYEKIIHIRYCIIAAYVAFAGCASKKKNYSEKRGLMLL